MVKESWLLLRRGHAIYILNDLSRKQNFKTRKIEKDSQIDKWIAFLKNKKYF